MPQCDVCIDKSTSKSVELTLAKTGILECKRCKGRWKEISALGGWCGYTKGAKLKSEFSESQGEQILEKAPLEKAPLEKEPLEKAPLEKEPLEKEPLEKEPLEKVPLEKAPLEKVPLETSDPVVEQTTPHKDDVLLDESAREQEKLKELEKEKQAEILRQQEAQRKQEAQILLTKKLAESLREKLLAVNEFTDCFDPSALTNWKEVTESAQQSIDSVEDSSGESWISKAQADLEKLLVLHKLVLVKFEERKKSLSKGAQTMKQFLEQKKYIGASTEQLDGIEKIKSVMKELAKKITTAKPTTALFEETQVTVSKFEKLIVEISERAKILSKLDSYPNELLAKVPKVFELQVKNALSKDPATKTYKQVLQDVRSNTASMEDLNSAKKSLTEVFDRLVDEQKQLITAVTEYWKEISQKIQKIQKGFASFAAEPLQVVETTISRVNKAASSAEPMEKHLLEQAKAKIDSRLIVALRLLERLQVILPNKVSMELRNTDEVIREQWKKLMGLLAIDPLDKEQLTVVCDRMESRQSFLRTVKEEGDKIKDLSTRVTEAIKLTKHEALRGEWEKLNQVFFTEPFVGENLEKLVESLEKWLLQLKTAIEKGRLLETARGAVTQRSTFTVDSRCIKALRDDGEERIAIAVFGGKSAITWNPHALGKKSGHDWTGWNSMQYKAGDGNYVLIYKFEGSKFVIGSTGTHRADSYTLSPDPEMGLRGRDIEILEYVNGDIVFDW